MSIKDDLGLLRPSIENVTNSEVIVDEATLLWTIRNFSCCEEIGNPIESPEFSSSRNRRVTWYLKLYPTNRECIGLYLHLSSNSEQKEVIAKFKFSIFDNKGKEIHSASQVFVKFGHYHGFREFFEKDASFREEIRQHNSLKIYCEVKFTRSIDIVEHQYLHNPLFLTSAEDKCESADILDILFKTRLLADVVISVKNKEFPAHKAILAARSTVFSAMFQHNTKENQHNRIEVDDTSEEVIAEMLHFVYNGRCSEKLDELAMELFTVADKYDLKQLKIISRRALCKNLSVENAVENLKFADAFDLEEIKNEVIKFIVANAVQVFESADWKTLSADRRLCDEVFKALALSLRW